MDSGRVADVMYCNMSYPEGAALHSVLLQKERQLWQQTTVQYAVQGNGKM